MSQFFRQSTLCGSLPLLSTPLYVVGLEPKRNEGKMFGGFGNRKNIVRRGWARVAYQSDERFGVKLSKLYQRV